MPDSNRRDLIHAGAAAAAAGWLASSSMPALSAERNRTAKARSLRITAIKSFLLQHKLKHPFGASVSVPLDKTRQALLVKIETNQGIVGWGETSPINGARGTIDDHLRPRLVGQNPLEHRRLWRKMWGPNFANALAVGALDMAINDVRGKALGLPVAELYGGRLRSRVPVYVSAMDYVEGKPPETYYPMRAAQMKKRGFRAMKMRVGRYPVEREAKVIESVRSVVGPKVRLLADGNAAYTMGSALQMGRVLHQHGFYAFEEPMPQSPKYAGYEELRKKLPLPLAAGEAVDSRASAKQLLDRRAMDIIQPDASLCGGIGEALFIGEMAALSGIRCFPHCWGADIVVAATIHLCALLPDPHWGFATDTPMLELDQSENPWRNGLARNQLRFRKGFVDVPTKPGLGIEVDEAMVKKYAV